MKKVLFFILVAAEVLLANSASAQINLAEEWKKVPLKDGTGWTAASSEGGTISVDYVFDGHTLVVKDGKETEITFTPEKTEMKKSDKCERCVVRTAEGKDKKGQTYQGTFVYEQGIIWGKSLYWLEVKLATATGTSVPVPKKS